MPEEGHLFVDKTGRILYPGDPGYDEMASKVRMVPAHAPAPAPAPAPKGKLFSTGTGKLTEEELRVFADEATPDDLDLLDENDLRRLARVVNQRKANATGSGVPGFRERSVKRVKELAKAPAYKDEGALGIIKDAAKTYGGELVEAGKQAYQLPADIMSGRFAQKTGLDELYRPKIQGPEPPATFRPPMTFGQKINAPLDKANRVLGWAARALVPGTDESGIAGQAILDIATSTGRDAVDLLSKPGTQLREKPGSALMSVADLAGVVAVGRKALTKGALKLAEAAGLAERRAGWAAEDAATAAAEEARVAREAADAEKATEAASRADKAAKAKAARERVLSEYPYNMLPESARTPETARTVAEAKAAKMRAERSPSVPDRFLPTADDILGDAAAVIEESPDIIEPALRAVGDKADELAEAATVVREANPVRAEALSKVASKLDALKARLAAAAGKTAQEQVDELRELARKSDAAGFTSPAVAAGIAAPAVGAASGYAAGAQVSDDQGGDYAIPGAILGGLTGAGGVKYFTDPRFQEAVKGALSIGGRQANFEELAGSIIEPLLPNRDVQIMGRTINPLRTFRRTFTETAGLPKEAAAQRAILRNRLSGRVMEIKDIAQRLESFDQSTRNEIERFMRGEINGDGLPAAARDAAIAGRTAFDELALDLIDVGLADGELANTLIENMGSYLPRLYLKHERGDAIEKVVRYLRQQGEPLSRLSDMSYFKKRADLPKEVREALGEISAEFGQAHPGYLLGRRGVQTAADIEFARYGRWLASSPDYTLPQSMVGDANSGVKFFTGPGGKKHAEFAGQRYRLMGDNKRLGVLRNRYVQEDVAYDLESMTESARGVRKFMDDATTFFKKSKVTYNPASLLRNIYGGLVMSDVGGGLSPARVDIYGKALRDYAKKTERYVEARAHGAFGGSYHGSEVAKLLAETEKTDNFAKAVLNWGKTKAKQPLAVMENVHEATEHSFKMALYNYGRDIKGMNPEQAAEFAKRIGFDYRDVPRWVQITRKSVFGAPFISFSYKAIPRVLESALAVGSPKKMWNFWKYPMALGAVNEYSARKLGVNEGDKGFLPTLGRVAAGGMGFATNRVKRLLPSYVGSQQMLLPWKDAFGRLQWWDATWTLPWGDLGEFGKGQVGQALAQAGIPFPRQLEPGNPWLQMVVAGMTKGTDPFTGKKIVRPEASAAEGAMDMAAWASRLWMPTLFPGGFSAEKLAKSYQEDYQTRPDIPKLSMALLSEVGGVKIRPEDPRQSYNFKAGDLEKRIREDEAEIRRLTVAGKKTEAAKLTERVKQLTKQFQGMYGSPQTLPPSDPRLYRR